MTDGEHVAFSSEIDNHLRLRLTGLTKREYFAAMAFQGLLAGDMDKAVSVEEMGIFAVGCADALIAALNEEG